MLIADLLARPHYGCHIQEQADLLNDLTAFAMDARNSMADRAKAIQRIDEVTGLPAEEKYDAAVVQRFVNQTAEFFGEDIEVYFPHYKEAT